MFGLFALAVALADEPDDLTIVVQDVLTVQEARDALDAELEADGYFREVRRDGDVVYRHSESWRPAVVVHADGRLTVRRRGVVVHPPGRDWSPDTPTSQYLKCLTPWTLVSCFSAKGLVMDRRKYQAHEAATVSSLHDEHADLVDALSAEAIDTRIDAVVSRMWFDGVDEDGTPLPEPADRRAAIGRLWASRAPGPWGDRARDRIAVFVAVVVQVSETPYTEDEITRIEQDADDVGRFADPPIPLGG